MVAIYRNGGKVSYWLPLLLSQCLHVWDKCFFRYLSSLLLQCFVEILALSLANRIHTQNVPFWSPWQCCPLNEVICVFVSVRHIVSIHFLLSVQLKCSQDCTQTLGLYLAIQSHELNQSGFFQLQQIFLWIVRYFF